MGQVACAAGTRAIFRTRKMRLPDRQPLTLLEKFLGMEAQFSDRFSMVHDDLRIRRLYFNQKTLFVKGFRLLGLFPLPLLRCHHLPLDLRFQYLDPLAPGLEPAPVLDEQSQTVVPASCLDRVFYADRQVE